MVLALAGDSTMTRVPLPRLAARRSLGCGDAGLLGGGARPLAGGS